LSSTVLRAKSPAFNQGAFHVLPQFQVGPCKCTLQCLVHYSSCNRNDWRGALDVQTRRCESDLPQHVFDPHWSESFTTFEPHPTIHFQNGLAPLPPPPSRGKSLLKARQTLAQSSSLLVCSTQKHNAFVILRKYRDWRMRTSAGVKSLLSGRDAVLLISVHDVKVEGPGNIIGFALIHLRAGAGVQDAWHPLSAGEAYVSSERPGGDELADPGLERPEVAGAQKGKVALRGHSGALAALNLRTSYSFDASK